MDAVTSNSYAAPEPLLKHCRRATPRPSTLTTANFDIGDVAGLVSWLHERGEFEEHDPWVSMGMALRIALGDAGRDVWELTKTDATDAVIDSKWESFSTEPDSKSVTLATWLKRAHTLGWSGSIRPSTTAMFSEVAQLAAASGASLSGQVGMPMLAGQEELTRLATPRLEEFLAGSLPAPCDLALPTSMSGHGLYSLLNRTIAHALTLLGKRGIQKRLVGPLAALSVANEEVFRTFAARADSLGHPLPLKKIRQAALNLTEEVQRITVTLDKWEYDPKTGRIESDNPDNVAVLLGMLGLEVRWNNWLEQMEVQGNSDNDFLFPDWTYVDDIFVARFITRAKRTKTRFCPGKDFTWESLQAFAHKNVVDPALEHLGALEREWDRVPRLSDWLSRTCNMPADAYHAAAARAIIGGMVRRIRQPGCKFDLMPVLFGPQGTGKSTVAKIIADMGQSSLSEINRRSTDWFSDEVLLGDASKELVLSLAGKCLVEIGEMGQRNSATIDHVKAMLSRQVDRGRTAYARAVSKRPRRNIFFGTVNGDKPLQDTSGNRRFLPLAVGSEVDLVWLSANIRQLVGEACSLEATGETFDLPREVWEAATAAQEAARALSPVEEACQEWFSGREDCYILPSDVRRALEMSRLQARSRYSAHMENMGWRYIQANTRGRDRVWVSRGTKPLGERACLVPWQGQVLGRVEMRVQAGSLK